MNIYEDIVKALKPAALEAEVRRIVFGSIYTAVELASAGGGRALGLAYVEGAGCKGKNIGGGENDRCCLGRGESLPVDGDVGLPVIAADLLAPLTGILEGMAGEGISGEINIPVAAASALAQFKLKEWETGDVLQQMMVGRGEKVTVVGSFPFTPKFAEMGADLTVFDRAFEDFNENEMNSALAGADVAVITGAALANGTLPDILKNVGDAREVILLGPTTPLVPEAFVGTPVTKLMGVIPTDINGVIDVVASGGGTRAFGPYVEKVGVRVGSSSNI